jgi:hypothetical protein
MLGDDFAAHSFLMIMLVISYSLSNCELAGAHLRAPRPFALVKLAEHGTSSPKSLRNSFANNFQFPIFLKVELAF